MRRNNLLNETESESKQQNINHLNFITINFK